LPTGKRLSSFVYETKRIISRQNEKSRKSERKLDRVQTLLQNAEKDPHYQKVMDIVDKFGKTLKCIK
jgi:hypothetical protein